ncbi:glycerol-3-phosphate 1-O-acyltransferase PlsY [Opitutaceae bacterium]|nr:glycerol-3-phosphate 1-O-acyltransferase PlsY [Opitutaceae bacterium]
MFLPLLATFVLSYVLGAVPFGYLVAKAKGVNIMEEGSKNPGATNVKRVVGKGAGNLVFVLDFLKGFLAVIFAGPIAGILVDVPFGEFSGGEIDKVVALVAAVLGHSFSVFLKFRGGKGVATAGGGMFVIMFEPSLIAIVTWVVVFYSTRYVSLASIAAAVVIMIAPWLMGFGLSLKIVATVMGLLVVIRHQANIKRLMAGTEHRWDRK